MLKIVHLSDSHFGTVLPKVKNGLLDCTKKIKPDLILFSGDITQRARRSQFRQAKNFCKNFVDIPVIAVPGNHDIPLFNVFERFINPYRGFKNLFKEQLEADFVYGDVLVSGLNSTSRWRHVQGSFDIPRIRKRLSERRVNAKVHIAVFHHPVDCNKVSDEKNLLVNAEDSMNVFNESGVDIVLSGHVHDPYVSLSNHRYPSINRNMIVSVAGTCLSWRTRPGAPNSFNLLKVETDPKPWIEITRFDCDESYEFNIKNRRNFSRNKNSGWQEIRS